MLPTAARWARYATERTYKPGEYVFREQDAGDALYFVAAGTVAIMKDAESDAPLVLGYRGKGEMIGEVSLIVDSPRTASVLAIEGTTLLELPRKEFWRLVDADQEFRHMVMHTLIDRLLVADESRRRAAFHERDLFARLASLSGEHERLAEIMQLRQETVQFIIHDLRNPLNLVTTALSMMEVDLDPESEMGSFMIIARRGLERMLALVEALLDVERLEGDDVVLNFDQFDMGRLLTEVVERVRPMAELTDVGISLVLPEIPLPVVTADFQRIDRVVQNLVDNAMKYTPPGKHITVRAEADVNSVLVAVDDEGPGIPPDRRDRLFARFAQLDANSNARRGFGLGLAYCRSAVQAHGGRIWVDDPPSGVGTRFIFSLPLKHNAAGTSMRG